MHKILLLTALAFLFGCSTNFTDERDGKKYKYVKIGEQTWMAENLNYNAENSICNGNDPANCEKYGRLYEWETAIRICPSGWHLPDTTEWNTLVDFAGGEEIAGNKLKAENGWNDDDGKSGNGEDKFGFAALPGGGGYSGGNFFNIGNYGYWWSANDDNVKFAYNRLIGYNHKDVSAGSNYEKSYMFSVRCIKD